MTHRLPQMVGRGLAVLLTIGAGASWAPASAHHGDTGEYDRTRPVLIAGTIVDRFVGSPHSEITVQVDRRAQPDLVSVAEEIDATFGSSTAARARLADPGAEVEVLFSPLSSWDEEDLAVGTHVEVLAAPRCPQDGQYDGEYRAMWSSVEDVTELNTDGFLVDYTAGCPDAGIPPGGGQQAALSDNVANGTALNPSGPGVAQPLWPWALPIAGLLMVTVTAFATRYEQRRRRS